MIVLTTKAFKDCSNFTVWRNHKWRTSFFNKTFGRTYNRKAKLICLLPFNFGLFWTFGKGWIE